jgi:hypothetical protein
MQSKLLVAALVLAIVIWWAFGPSVSATVTVPQDEVKATYKQQSLPPVNASPAQPLDLSYVDELPDLPAGQSSAQVTDPLEPPPFYDPN